MFSMKGFFSKKWKSLKIQLKLNADACELHSRPPHPLQKKILLTNQYCPGEIKRKKKMYISLSLYYNINIAISGEFRFTIGSNWPFYRDKSFTSYKLYFLSTVHPALSCMLSMNHYFLGNTSFIGFPGLCAISGGSTSTLSLLPPQELSCDHWKS